MDLFAELNDVGFPVEITADNNFVITGYTTITRLSDPDINLIKLNSNGDTLWTKLIGDSLNTEIARDIKLTAYAASN